MRYVITKFSRIDSLPNFVTHDAQLRAVRARESSANKSTKDLVYCILLYHTWLLSSFSPFRYFPFHFMIFSHQVITVILASMTSATHTAAFQHALLKSSLDKVLDDLPRILVLLSSHHQKICMMI